MCVSGVLGRHTDYWQTQRGVRAIKTTGGPITTPEVCVAILILATQQKSSIGRSLAGHARREGTTTKACLLDLRVNFSPSGRF